MRISICGCGGERTQPKSYDCEYALCKIHPTITCNDGDEFIYESCSIIYHTSESPYVIIRVKHAWSQH